ncbi:MULTISPECIES: haloacid dehalogenase type II [Phaeobacter]|uniref:(S)-2-haloacid dehalogenase n=1 Tax=Phaeobacter piscinae TaxID=1580596 RepID=A0ABM6PA96_9RHOB|nr:MULTISPECIES: haloacid dehalogenase type II [Phaeobacter]ATG34553.1 haloacid dehalogenase, type II [Phaeobacter piscinae]AUQ85073.1 haloacid dehalogenase, type II [Phaeobacter piscinae]AUR22957.1 haloacid dehalogenase, type II [Phaeobacter piscinae]KII14365.1 haloacid dehalogenase [Phaeobacter sp. S60]
MAITTCIFDAYGTLFDVTAAARQAAQEPEFPHLIDHWAELANHWRLKQLQYTWLRAITDAHTDFWQVTQDGLDWAMEATGLSGDPQLRKRLLDLYWQLQAYEEVPQMLRALKTAGLQTAILSNGSPKMLEGAVNSAGVSGLLDDVLSVEAVGVFKPDAQVYDLVEERFNCQRDEVLFVSSNGWDAAGAAGYGFTTAWVNRSGEPMDRLPWTPHHILSDLSSIPTLLGT